MSVTPEIYLVFQSCHFHEGGNPVKHKHMKLNNLIEIIRDRKLKMPTNSYVASLFRLGEDRIIQKVGEEAIEVVIAAKNKNKQRIISEVSDLIFQLFILLTLKEITLSDIEKELESRTK